MGFDCGLVCLFVYFLLMPFQQLWLYSWREPVNPYTSHPCTSLSYTQVGGDNLELDLHVFGLWEETGVNPR